MAKSYRWIGAALIGVAASLLLAGTVSGTPIRHVIQILPVAFALAAVARRTSWAPYAALAVLFFWLFIMSLIWLYISGIAKIVTGTFSTVEIALTVCVGASCLVGVAAWWRTTSSANVLLRAIAFVGFAAIQTAAMWLSLRPVFESR